MKMYDLSDSYESSIDFKEGLNLSKYVLKDDTDMDSYEMYDFIESDSEYFETSLKETSKQFNSFKSTITEKPYTPSTKPISPTPSIRMEKMRTKSSGYKLTKITPVYEVLSQEEISKRVDTISQFLGYK